MGAKLANPLGLSDMHGNVWEWCLDWFGNYPGGDFNDFRGFPHDNRLRIIRGGSWASLDSSCRSASRSASRPEAQVCDIGFRIVLGCDPAAQLIASAVSHGDERLAPSQ